MFRLPMLLLVVLCLGCKENKVERKPESVSPLKLVRYYQDPTDATYTNAKIEVYLIAQDYTCVEGEGVYWYHNGVQRWPTIIFRCTPPKDNTKAVTIVGTCLGITRDGHDRKSGIDFYITVGDCSVTPR